MGAEMDELSGPRLTERIDMWVEKFDPAGIREPRPVRDDRYVESAHQPGDGRDLGQPCDGRGRRSG